MTHRTEATVAVRVRPRAARNNVGGVYRGANGPALVVAVQEPAVDGRATKAVLEAVARALGVSRSNVLLRTGERSRDKLLTIVDPPADLERRLHALRDGVDPGGDAPGAGAPGGPA
jgi:uncharacterized protein YggU (UPF0235/DUF167 family)